MGNYQKAMGIKNATRAAMPGDIVTCQGIKAKIAAIHYQDFSPSDRNDGTCDWDIEFMDTEGNYRHWKSYFDGGSIKLI